MITIIIVTHNSQAVIGRCLDALERQTVQPLSVILVDAGSADTGYLQPYGDQPGMTVLPEENIGFSRANNIGYLAVAPETEFVLFLNPDAFPEPNVLKQALAFFADNGNKDVGCLGGRLLGYDCNTGHSSGRLDSTGVFRKWYGRWYDRGQGEQDDGRYMRRENLPAACGAFLFCRKTVLDQVALGSSAEKAVFDPDFFLYKEDIELCLRIRKAGWRIVYLPELIVYHCRGWQRDRGKIPYQLRLTAAASELLLYRRHPSPYILWASAKYLSVRLLRI